MPVTTRIITAESGSSRSVKSAVKSPDVIQLNTGSEITRASVSRDTSCTTENSDTAKDATITPHATAPAAALLTRFPRLAFARKPRNGNSGMRSSISDS